ncbi:MAG: class I SAM-dependent methyltransferase [Actinomycetota bacterium]
MNGLLRRLVVVTHMAEHVAQWKIPPEPDWANHHHDVYWAWQTRGKSFFVERGIFNLLVIGHGATVLDICCGDGFNSRYFYAERAASVLAVDINADAIRYARRFNAASNVVHRQLDILSEFPSGRFSNVVWDAAIEHFSHEEAVAVLENAKAALTERGVVSGYTLIEQASPSGEYFQHHDQVFRRKGDLLNLVAQVFSNVAVLETQHPTRTNLYFWASENPNRLPVTTGDANVTSMTLGTKHS